MYAAIWSKCSAQFLFATRLGNTKINPRIQTSRANRVAPNIIAWSCYSNWLQQRASDVKWSVNVTCLQPVRRTLVNWGSLGCGAELRHPVTFCNITCPPASSGVVLVCLPASEPSEPRKRGDRGVKWYFEGRLLADCACLENEWK